MDSDIYSPQILVFDYSQYFKICTKMHFHYFILYFCTELNYLFVVFVCATI